MVKILYPHQPKIRATPVDIVAKSANNHLRLLQSTAKAENAFSIIPMTMNLFDKTAPVIYETSGHCKHNSGELRSMLFNRITKGSYPNLMFILSAYDPQRIRRCIPEDWEQGPPANVMYNLTIQNQSSADTLIPNYLKLRGNKAVSLHSQTSKISLLPWLQTGKIIWLMQQNAPEIDMMREIAIECEATRTPYLGVWHNKYYFANDSKGVQYPNDIFYSAYDACNQPPKPKMEVTRGFIL